MEYPEVRRLFYLKVKNEDGSSNELTYVDVEYSVLSKSDSLESNYCVILKKLEKRLSQLIQVVKTINPIKAF